jgi:putative ABC transport system ATP-binding protein
MSKRPLAVEMIDVHKSFDGGVIRALDGVSLSIAQGEFVAITGPSGCGKSTLLHLIGALDHPTSGRVIVNGIDIAGGGNLDRFRRSEIGLIFQFHDLLPHLSAVQNVEIPMFGTHRDGKQRHARARELLDEVDLAGQSSRRPTELSGGERQRVAIARALANEPAVLLADEPTGSLDSVSVERVLALFGQLRAERAVTIVMVTHDHAVAAAADRIVAMSDGRIVAP